MKNLLVTGISIVCLLGAGSAFSLELGEADPGVDPGPGDWPGFHLSVGGMYSPAPKIDGYKRRFFVAEKLLDQAGLRNTFDWRIWEYGLIGGFLDTSFSSASYLVDTGMRVGALFEVNAHWALYAVLFAELSYFRVGNQDHMLDPDRSPSRKKYAGWGAGGAVGFRYRDHAHVGAFVELSGVANRFDATSMNSEEIDFESPYLARIQIVAGFLFGFFGAEQDGSIADDGK